MKNLSVRNIPPELAEALNRERHRRQSSLNQTVIDLLSQGLGLTEERQRSNQLRRLGGNWSEAEFREFHEATASTRA